MPKYKNYQSICDAALTPYQDAGFSIINGTKLYYFDEPVETFVREELTITGLHQACENTCAI